MDKDDLICVVDDDTGLREAISDFLRAVGYKTSEFDSAEAFLGSKERDSCGCVIADFCMGGLSGIELAKHLSAARNAPRVVLITGHQEEVWSERAMCSGAVGFLRKPFDTKQLLELIGRSPTG